VSRADILESLRTNLAELQAISPERLERLDLDASNFKAFKELFEIFRITSSKLSYAALDSLPENALQELQTQIARAGAVVRGVAELRPTDPNWQSSRSALSSQLEKLQGSYFRGVAPFLAYSTSQDLADIREDLLSALASFKEAAAHSLTETTESSKEANRVLTAAKDALVGKTIADHAQQFDTEARTHGRRALAALAAVSLFAGGAAGYGVWLFQHPLPIDFAGLAPPERPAALLQLLVAKLVILSLIVTGTLAALRIYRAHRHNAIVNKHRHNVLKAFEAMAVASKDDPGLRSAILHQVTRSIFAPQPTGFLSHEPDPAPGGPILEMYRGLSESSRG